MAAKLLASIVGDLLGAAGLPGSGLASAAIEERVARAVEARKRNRLEAFMDELRRGEATLETIDDEAEIYLIMHRIDRAATEGVARLNLRLMAQVVNGQAHRGRIYADEFHRFADPLASLSFPEICLLAEAVASGEQGYAGGYSLVKGCPALIAQGILASKEDYRATAGALGRTGFVIGRPAVGGSTNYSTSPLFHRLLNSIDLQGARTREGSKPSSSGKPS